MSATGGTLTGTGALARLVLRRDRVILPLWTVLLGILPMTYAASISSLYRTTAQREAFADLSNGNVAFRALYGPVYDSSVGGLATWRAGFLSVIIGIAALLTVIRHTRAEEDAGRRELVGATVVGRHAPLAAALLVTCGASLALGAVAALGMISQGLPPGGSVAIGLQFAGAGVLFAAVAAVAAQLTEGAGAARGLAISVVGGSYLLRVLADTAGVDWLHWVTPTGWLQQLRPYAGERWWVLAVVAVAAAALLAVAVALSARRDVGAGVLPTRLGPAGGAPSLRTPFALAWRLHRGLLVSWVAGLTVIGAVLGAAGDGIDAMFEDNPQLREAFDRMGGQGAIEDVYFAAVFGIVGLAAGAYGVQAALRMRTEESAMRAEPVLAASVGRLRWLGSHLVFALVGPALALVAAAVGAVLVYGATTGDFGASGRMFGTALVQLPAVWVLAGLAVALFGLVPVLTPVSWAVLAACGLLGQLGALLRLSQWMLDLSPFTHVPRVSADGVAATPLVWLTVTAAALVAVGLTAFRRRDVG